MVRLSHVVEADFNAYLHGQLDQRSASGIRSHLRQCPSCGDKMATLMITELAQFRDAPADERPDRRKEVRFRTDVRGSIQSLCPLSLDRFDVEFLDYSRNGFGIVSPVALQPGAIVHLESGYSGILGEVRHCRTVSGGRYHVGIRLRTVEGVLHQSEERRTVC